MTSIDCSEHFFEIMGRDALSDSSLAFKGTGETIDFMVTSQKQKHYLELCSSVILPTNPTTTINQYTDHTTQLYAKVNLALASDSHVIKNFSSYINELKASVISQPLLDDCVVYRGCNLSKREIDEMEKLGSFFIPSFTSTSIDRNKAYSKSALLVIKYPYSCKYMCSITDLLSKYYNQEKEVLISCYSAFRLERIEKTSTCIILSLYLDEHLSAKDSI